MLAARSSGGGLGGGGHQQHHSHRKQSVGSFGGAKAQRCQDAKRSSSSGQQSAQHRHKAALIREIETSWYLNMFGLGKEDTVAHRTGMPYSDSPAHMLSGSTEIVTVFNTRGQH
ncbi:Voltage-gated potassium channel subunit beta-1 [Liparis tanakae]|uniref:Voltage-gated potassium channel subunit beta-1 n=1 Tax=Liparis tanakae TaxID=230148 RepID=A0A4Z2HXZ2_9TELE|nr:Voltage-gated potassium channel subunit beta-1 [Liparis tanakae]